MADPAPFQTETSVDPVTGQSIVAVTAFGPLSSQYRATFISSASYAPGAASTIAKEASNIAAVVQAAVGSPTMPPGDVAPQTVPVPAGDPVASIDILDPTAVADAAVPG